MMFDNISIIGASVSGLTLALLLKKDGFNVTVYELRGPISDSDGANAITLAPNGLKTFAALGSSVVDRICNKGYGFQDLTFRGKGHEYLDRYEVGNEEKYEYNAYRIYRQIILDELRAFVEQAGITIVYNKKFSHVVSETSESVLFEFDDGTQESANLLIGADGIHSRVRRYILPDIEPTWSGAVAVSAAAATDAVQFPDEEYRKRLPASIHGPTGAVHMAPQNAPGTETVIAVQWVTEERSRDGWQELENDKAQLRKVMEDLGGFNEVTRSAIAAARDDVFAIWPFYTMPRLPRWYSSGGKVLIVGDSAHAIPPSGGQGANQALEDVYMLSLVMVATRDSKVDWGTSLEWWQRVRQERVAKVIEFAGEIRKRRMPGWTGEGAATLDGKWLYGVDIASMVQEWVQRR